MSDVTSEKNLPETEEEALSSSHLTASEVGEAFQDALTKAHENSKKKPVIIGAGMMPPDKIDKEELLQWEERITAPNRGIIATEDFTEPETI